MQRDLLRGKLYVEFARWAKAWLGLAVRAGRLYVADGEGFEPPVPLGTAVFKTATIDHSVTRPR